MIRGALMGDIIVLRGHDWDDKLIQKYGRTKFTHVGIYFDDGLVISSRLPVVGIDRPNPDEYKIFSVRGLTAAGRRKVVCWALENVGKKYDLGGALYVGILNFLGVRSALNKWASRRNFICTEFVVRAFQAIDIDLTPAGLNIENLIPDDFINFRELEPRENKDGGE